MVTIYILSLENNRFYVGKTDNIDFRIEQHFNSNASVWTRKYKPISIIDIIKNCDDFDEDKYTIKYMEQYGIENVRGGIFCSLELQPDEINLIKKMIIGSSNRCYSCEEKGHFANKCPNNELIKLRKHCLNFIKKTPEVIYLVDVRKKEYYNFNRMNLGAQGVFLNEVVWNDNYFGPHKTDVDEFRKQMLSRGNIDILYNKNLYIVYGNFDSSIKLKNE